MRKIYSLVLIAVGLLISGNSWAAGDKNDATQDAVCKIGDQYYSTFAKAIADVPTTGVETVVELLKDCDANGVSIASTKNVTLNCNQFILANSNISKNSSTSANNYPVLNVSGTLTLNGTANEDGTKVGGIDGLNYGAMIIKSLSAKITINSGRYQSQDNMPVIKFDIESMDYYTNPNKIAELVINGGDFKGGNNGMFGMIINNNSSKNVKITINNGRFDAVIETNAGSTNRTSLIYSDRDNASVIINGGLFTIDKQSSGDRTFSCVDIRGTSNVTITNGEFINKTAAEKISTKSYYTALTVYDGASATRSGGHFKSLNGAGSQIFTNEGKVSTINIEDATFEGGGSYGLIITNYVENNQITLNGGYYKSTASAGLYVGAKSKVDFKWGKVEGTTDGLRILTNANVSITGGIIQGGTDNGIKNESDGTINIGGTANISGNSGLYTNNGTININGGQINATGSHAINVEKKSDKVLAKINFSGTPIITSNAEDGIALYNNGGTIAIDGGRFKAPSATVFGQAGSITLSDGIYSKEPTLNDYCAVKPDYEVITNPDPSTVDVYPFAIGKQTFNEVQVNEGERTIDWQTLSTWAGETIIPDKGDNVTIADGKDVEVGQSKKTEAYAHQITVDNGSKLIIDGGSKLTVGNGGITLGNNGDGGKIIIKATATDGTGALLFSPVADKEVTTVEATIELRTEARKENDEYIWYYFGIPLDIQKGQFNDEINWTRAANNGADTDLGTAIQKWDIVNGWQSVWTEALEPFKGFAITNNSIGGVTYTFKGKLLGNVSQQFNFTHKGYQFLANSYTAPMDIEALLNGLSENVKATIYMFDSESNTFKTVSKSAFTGFIPPVFRTIPIMNGFFILMDDQYSASESVNYGNVVYNCNLPNGPLNAPVRQAEVDFSRVRININSTTGKQDAMYLVENSDFTDDFENGYDEVKYMNNGLNVFANTTYGNQSAVFSDDLEGTIISMNATNDQVFTLSFDEQVGDLYTLTDIVTGHKVTMDANSTYTFTADKQHMGQRFMVTKANSISTDMECVKSAAKKSGVYSITGQYFGKTANMNALPKGVYIINGTKVVK